MRFLAQKLQESAAERHYSVVDNIQSKNRGKLRPESVKKRCLFRLELMQEIAEWANGVNQGLQTVDEAAAEDEAAACLQTVEEAAAEDEAAAC